MSSIAQQLFEEGRLEGLATAKVEKELMRKEFATKLLKHSKMSKPEVSLMTDMPLSEVEAIAKELNLPQQPTL